MNSRIENPLKRFIEHQGCLILDAGLATDLEARGYATDAKIWSAQALIDNPALIRQVHLDHLEAGADCVLSSSYQATVAGFMAKGLDNKEAESKIRESVQLAVAARKDFWLDETNQKNRIRPLVAASVGPYGAYLADGSEYRGDYSLGRSGLKEFHHDRLFSLGRCGADLLACETIPSAIESEVLVDILDEAHEFKAWISFSCRDGEHISDGTPLRRAALRANESEWVLAIGVNCTAPRFIPSLIKVLGQVTEKPIVVYPNTGEAYDPITKTWATIVEPVDFGGAAKEWYNLGARIVGGCCRTGVDHVQSIRSALIR